MQLQLLLFILIAFFICFSTRIFCKLHFSLFYTSLIERLECIWYHSLLSPGYKMQLFVLRLYSATLCRVFCASQLSMDAFDRLQWDENNKNKSMHLIEREKCAEKLHWTWRDEKCSNWYFPERMLRRKDATTRGSKSHSIWRQNTNRKLLNSHSISSSNVTACSDICSIVSFSKTSSSFYWLFLHRIRIQCDVPFTCRLENLKRCSAISEIFNFSLLHSAQMVSLLASDNCLQCPFNNVDCIIHCRSQY